MLKYIFKIVVCLWLIIIKYLVEVEIKIIFVKIFEGLFVCVGYLFEGVFILVVYLLFFRVV